MNSISFNPNVNNVNFQKKSADEVENTNLLKQKAETDNFTKEDRQVMIKKAKTKAAGWSIFGGVWSTLYYGLRSDKKIAKKFDLDAENDKALIRQIRNEQVTATLPGAFSRGLLGIFNWAHHKRKDASKYEV